MSINIESLLEYMKQMGVRPQTEIAGTPPFLPSPTIARPTINPTPPRPMDEVPRPDSGSFDEQMSKPMPQFDYKPQQQVGGIRGLLAMLASGIGHGAGANSVGGGITRSFEGLQDDADRRRQLDYQRQAQQFKNVYDAEADRRQNLVRIVQQRRADAEQARRAAHEGRMESIAGDRAAFDMAKAGQNMIEKGEDRASADARAAADRASRENIAKGAQASALERAKIHSNASRANAQLRAGNRGEMTPVAYEKAIATLGAQLKDVNSKIAAYKSRTNNKGKLMNPPDAQGNHARINGLWNQQKAIQSQMDRLNSMYRQFSGAPEEQAAPPQDDPILSLFSDILQ